MTNAPKFGSPAVRTLKACLPCAAVAAWPALAILAGHAGCASSHREMPAIGETWDWGVEVRFPAAAPAPVDNGNGNGNGNGEAAPAAYESRSTVVAAPDKPMPRMQRLVRGIAAVSVFAFDQLGLMGTSRPLKGIPEYDDTKYTLIPGTYAFKYESADFRPVYGEAHLYPVITPRARDFIRHSSIALTPSPLGRPAVLSEADLDRARSGDVVTKVVFVADPRAIHDRLDDIDKGLRELARVRASLNEQLAYWNRKLTDRRVNTRYSSDFGWGIDVPSWDLALLQSVVGPERYHWHRFSEAEDQVRTYEEKITQLDLPARNLREERDALKQMLQAIDVMHRSHDLLVLAPSMIRSYHDPVDEVHGFRGVDAVTDLYRGKIMHNLEDWVGPWGRFHFPYWYSSLVNFSLMPGLRGVAAPSMALTKPVGEVLMVIQVGARRPPELGGHSWVANP